VRPRKTEIAELFEQLMRRENAGFFPFVDMRMISAAMNSAWRGAGSSWSAVRAWMSIYPHRHPDAPLGAGPESILPEPWL